ncbi:MAG TPA: hypothetical protein VL992_07025 [Tepidisphaeraceae bacterium]|nr:hypothetical protein [Tepidisphaeraceae bacterium]
MRPPLKLSAIDQEHLQELYDETGVARDELPYTEAYDKICQGFQDRTFKNAHPEQVYAALLKHVRSGSRMSKEAPVGAVLLSEEQLKQLKGLLPRHAKSNKIMPYSDEFEAAYKEFVKVSSVDLSSADFWRAIGQSAGPKRRPPQRKAAVVVAAAAEDEDE